MLIALGILLLVLMVAVGGDRGFGSFLALLMNILVMFVALKLISYGINPYVVVIAASLLVVFVTLIYQNGANEKTLASLMAVGIVMLILSLVVIFIVKKTNLAGYSEVDQYEEITMYLSTNIMVRMDRVMACVVLLGLLGAIMDTSIAITTAVYEVSRNNKTFTSKELLASGKNVGKDIMGTTVNTLLFASMGETIMLIIVYLRYHYSLGQLLNSKSFFQEFSLIAFSNIGCLLIIPISNRMISNLLVSKHQYACKIRAYCDKKREENKDKE